VRPDGVIKLQVFPIEVLACRTSRRREDRLFIFDRLPHPLDENVVAPAAAASMLILMPCFLQQPGEGLAGELHPNDEDLSLGTPELTALIGVEYLRFSFLERASSKASMQKLVSMVIDSARI